MEAVSQWATSSLRLLMSVIGKVPCSIRNLRFIRPMTHSTWLRTAAMDRKVSTSMADSCHLPLVNAGIISSVLHMLAKLSCRVNPLSAKIRSPGMWRWGSINPDCLTSSTSETLPPHTLDRNNMDRIGVQPVKNSTVLCFILLDHMTTRPSRWRGWSMNISKQSIKLVIWGDLLLKLPGRYKSTKHPSGHFRSCPTLNI